MYVCVWVGSEEAGVVVVIGILKDVKVHVSQHPNPNPIPNPPTGMQGHVHANGTGVFAAFL